MQNSKSIGIPFLNRRLLVVCLLGFSSGLPLAFSASFLQGWFAVSGVAVGTIGFLGLLGLPYTLKFLWSPLLDRYVLPFCGRRRGWILLTQLALALSMGSMVFFEPQHAPVLLALLGLVTAFLSATQDIAFDAYRAEVLQPQERGLGAAFTTTGYRLAMLTSGGGAFILADYFGWSVSVLTMASFMILGGIVSFFAPEPVMEAKPPATLLKAIVEPLQEFLSRPHAAGILLLILLYKMGDAFAGSLSVTFLLRGLGVSLTEVGALIKVVGLVGILTGVFLGGIITPWLGMFRSLMLFGLLSAATNLLYALLAVVGKNYFAVIAVILTENLCTGMGTVALISLLMSLCDVRYTATQFALLSSLAGVGRVLISSLSGKMVESMGWANFYLWTFVIALPGLGVLFMLRETLSTQQESLEKAEQPIEQKDVVSEE